MFTDKCCPSCGEASDTTVQTAKEGASSLDCLTTVLCAKQKLFTAEEHFYSALLVCGLILLRCLGDTRLRKTTQHLTVSQSVSRLCHPESCSELGNVKGRVFF